MKRRLRFFIALLVLNCLVSLGAAQSPGGHAYSLRQGDLWRYDFTGESASQLTEWGYNGGPILSPDGGKIAYLSTAPEFVARFQAGAATQTSGTAPANIWVMRRANESFQLVAGQTGAGETRRSLPSWSPDGLELAWLQLDAGQPVSQATLRIHDFATDAAYDLASAVDLGFQESNIRLPSLRWGGGGIALLHYAFPAGESTPRLAIEFYDPATSGMRRYDLGLLPDRSNTVRDFEWVNHQGRSLMALQIQNYWELLDPQTGARSRLAQPPRLKNRQLQGGMELIPLSVASARFGWEIHWAAEVGGQRYDTGYKSARVNRNDRPALSHDGATMAWQDSDRVSIWQRGTPAGDRPVLSGGLAFPIPPPSSLVWAPTEWVTTGATGAPQTAPAQPPAASCPLPPLLSAGELAIVSPGLANRVRSGPSVNADAVGRLQAGEVAVVEQGPVCADGYHWYSVRNPSIAGWTAEGGAGEYWLLYHKRCPGSPPTRLTTSMRATVAEGRTRGIRSGPSEDSTAVVTVVAAGEAFLIAGKPECDAAGIRWFPVRQDAQSGWIAEGQGDEYWIEPVAP